MKFGCAQPPNSPNACNPSAKWDLASIHRHTPNMAYVEGKLDWECETDLDITRELDRTRPPALRARVALICLSIISKYSVSQSEILAQCKPIGIHLLIQLYLVIS
ncbi:hypothetical protein CRG98_018873 [Punica granatum]|uniref:Uncharacterized protein n=1 Tax=Punica granatum TaxID=22663 RepID=A0A2I0JY24_PUNGR|nr:hypothetical protein CRG98_018873 [Punica granatum]